jgi:hypothetical protein
MKIKMHYQLGLKGEIENKKSQKNNDQIENINT